MVLDAMVVILQQLGHFSKKRGSLLVTNLITHNGVVPTALNLVSITLSGKSPLAETLSLPLIVSHSAQKAMMLVTLVIRSKLKMLSQFLTMSVKFSLKFSTTDQ